MGHSFNKLAVLVGLSGGDPALDDYHYGPTKH
jgi:hypothetical protein